MFTVVNSIINPVNYFVFDDGAGGVVVSVVASHPSGSGINSSRRRWDFLRRKISDHVFLRKGSKAVGPGLCVDRFDM